MLGPASQVGTSSSSAMSSSQHQPHGRCIGAHALDLQLTSPEFSPGDQPALQ